MIDHNPLARRAGIFQPYFFYSESKVNLGVSIPPNFFRLFNFSLDSNSHLIYKYTIASGNHVARNNGENMTTYLFTLICYSTGERVLIRVEADSTESARLQLENIRDEEYSRFEIEE